MTIDAYFNPDFTWDKKFIYFLMAFAGMMICVFLIIGVTVIGAKLGKKKDQDETYEEDGTKAGVISAELVLSRVQMFYEMVISGTTAIFFACSYIIMNHLYAILSDMQAGSYGEPYLSFMYIWDNYKDFVTEENKKEYDYVTFARQFDSFRWWKPFFTFFFGVIFYFIFYSIWCIFSCTMNI